MKHITFYTLFLLLAVSAGGQNCLLPSDMEGEQHICHTAYTLSYNPQHNQPSWVAYLLTSKHAQGDLKRKDSFKADPLVTNGSATPDDYRSSGYDKGHLAPNADMNWDLTVQQECFYMSNMSPQTHAFNAGLWSRLESLVRDWAIAYDSIYVVTGPVLTEATVKQCYAVIRNRVNGVCDTSWDCVTLIQTTAPFEYIGKKHLVSVPEYFYKVVYCPSRGEAIGFLVPHENKKGLLQSWVVTVDDIEHVTGIDFFPELDDELEDRIESTVCVECWDWDR